MEVYAVFINGDCDGEFKTRNSAEKYVRDYIRGTAETYRKTQKYIREHNEIEIQVIEYD